MIIGGQVLIAPAMAFAIAYLVEIDTDAAALSIQLELMPWILSAALAYGIISFILALVAGGFMHFQSQILVAGLLNKIEQSLSKPRIR